MDSKVVRGDSKRDEKSKVFDIEKGKVDLSLMKVTDIPTVRRLLPPKPAKIEEETYLLNTKRILMKTAKEYVEKNCNKKGEVKVSNISKTEEKGIKEIEDEIKNGNRVVFNSDKTGVLTYDSVNNYMAALDVRREETAHTRCTNLGDS